MGGWRMRRFASYLLMSLVLLALAGLAASCGGESYQTERPAKEEASNSAPAEDTKSEKDTRAEAREDKKAQKDARTKAREDKKETQEAEADGQGEGAGSDQYEEADADQYENADAEQYENANAAPASTAMSMSIPKLGISGALVSEGEAGLEAGAMHLAGTGYPWQSGANTYIAGHRVGFPGTGSDHIFYSLPAMAAGDEVTLEDSNGEVYNYRVSEVFAVTPYDLWVTAPTSADTVTLQVCTESPEDWFTIGPSLMESGPESGRLIVRAVRVA